MGYFCRKVTIVCESPLHQRGYHCNWDTTKRFLHVCDAGERHVQQTSESGRRQSASSLSFPWRPCKWQLLGGPSASDTADNDDVINVGSIVEATVLAIVLVAQLSDLA